MERGKGVPALEASVRRDAMHLSGCRSFPWPNGPTRGPLREYCWRSVYDHRNLADVGVVVDPVRELADLGTVGILRLPLETRRPEERTNLTSRAKH